MKSTNLAAMMDMNMYMCPMCMCFCAQKSGSSCVVSYI